MVISEYLSKYHYVKPIKSKTAKEISVLLWDYIYINLFRPPRVILTDNGTEFVNKVVKSIYKKWNSKIISNITKRPRGRPRKTRDFVKVS